MSRLLDEAPNVLRQPLGQHLEQACAEPSVLGDWALVVRGWLRSAAGQALVAAVEQRQVLGARVYPAQVLRALALTPLDTVRILILGQDPYHGPGQAQGLAFSVAAHSRLPPSLRNILQELQRDLGTVSVQAASGDLSHWARQGVLLLNTSLTVEDGQAGSHARLGWDLLTDGLVRAVAQRPKPLAALLWGAHAQAKAPLLAGAGPAAAPRLVLACSHPSPLSARRPPAPFVACAHFSQAQAFLKAHEPTRPAVDW
jgi:uracil-DNA glycosylase